MRLLAWLGLATSILLGLALLRARRAHAGEAGRLRRQLAALEQRLARAERSVAEAAAREAAAGRPVGGRGGDVDPERARSRPGEPPPGRGRTLH